MNKKNEKVEKKVEVKKLDTKKVSTFKKKKKIFSAKGILHIHSLLKYGME